MNRDKKDFVLWWELLRFEEKVEYHVGIDFETQPNELVIVDEADSLIFSDPRKFLNFIDTRPCICFTATPDSSVIEGKVIELLNFKKMKYPIDDMIKS